MDKLTEILKTSGKEEFECPNEMIMDLLQSSRPVGGGMSRFQMEMLIKIFIYASRSGFKIPAIAMTDGSVLIGGRTVEGEGLTPFQISLIHYMVRNQSATTVELASEVWHDVSKSSSGITSMIGRVNIHLGKFHSKIEYDSSSKQYYFRIF